MGRGGPEVSGRYEIVETITTHEHGALHRAIDRVHDRSVALKMLKVVDDVTRDQLLGETRMLMRLTPHPGLPVVRDDFTLADGTSVVIIDWVEGIDLATLLEERGAPGLVRTAVVDYVVQAADALDHLHQHDPPIVHGDVKPSNLVLTPTGKIVLLDFGIARLGGQRVDAGTRGFMAPEIAEGAPCTPAADVYGLAATAYALLTGDAASVLPTWEGLDPTDVASLSVVLRRGLATDPARRYRTAGEFAERLRAGRRSLPHGVVTLLSVELVDVDDLWESDAEYAAALCDRLVEVVGTAVDEGGGWLLAVGAGGGHVLAAVTSASGAVSIASHVRERVAGERLGDGAEVASRIAIHTGEPEVRDGRYVGAVVARVERVRARAAPGEILVSTATAALVGDRLPAGFRVAEDGAPASPPSNGSEAPVASAPGRVTAVDTPKVVRLRAECEELEAVVRRHLLQEHEAKAAGQVALSARFLYLAGQAGEQLVAKRHELDRESRSAT